MKNYSQLKSEVLELTKQVKSGIGKRDDPMNLRKYVLFRADFAETIGMGTMSERNVATIALLADNLDRMRDVAAQLRFKATMSA